MGFNSVFKGLRQMAFRGNRTKNTSFLYHEYQYVVCSLQHDLLQHRNNVFKIDDLRRNMFRHQYYTYFLLILPQKLFLTKN
jgi:hypothetical protein